MHRALCFASLTLVLSCGPQSAEVGSGLVLGESEGELRNQGYNCNRDKRLDAPGSFTVEVLSSAKLRLRLTPGSDAAGIGGYSYLVSGGGASESFSAVRLTCFGNEVLLDGSIDGLTAGTQYSVTLLTSDKCGNTFTTPAQLATTPAQTAEATGPVVASFGLSSVNFFGSSVPVLLAVVEDGTGMDRVEFWADGVKIGTDTLKSTGGLWSHTLAFYTPPGANYFTYPTRGQTRVFEARAFDLFGNVTVVAKELTVP
jgi:hypothetical protein